METKDIKAAILNPKNLKRITASTKDFWGLDVTILEWDGPSRDKFEAFCMSKRIGEGKNKKIKDMIGALGLVAYLSVIDPISGGKVFASPAEADKANGRGLLRVFEAARDLNAIGEEAETKAREDLEKAPGASSSTASPTPGAAQ